jgi:prolipoprotein diacylglyceryl transferase
MESLLTITWDAGRGLDLGFFTLRYYSLLFAGGFVLGYLIMRRIFEREGIPEAKLDTLLTYVVIATVLGARLGHVFFYQWDYYSQHLAEIPKVWEGGLASHGAAIGIIIAIIIYCRRVLHKPVLWMLDRLVITVALAGCLIRLGNFANSEIYGQMANAQWETVFTNPVRERIMAVYGRYLEGIEFRETDRKEVADSLIHPIYEVELQFAQGVQKDVAQKLVSRRISPYLAGLSKENTNFLIPPQELNWQIDQAGVAVVEGLGIPRRPTQLYEALAYLLIFFILARLYLLAPVRLRHGLLFGLFLILVFGFRFFIEFYKENQVSAEQGDLLNIGQKLSIPLVVLGIFFSLRKLNNPENE